MTIPEACQLVMEAATISTGNQICVFDMGKFQMCIRDSLRGDVIQHLEELGLQFVLHIVHLGNAAFVDHVPLSLIHI